MFVPGEIDMPIPRLPDDITTVWHYTNLPGLIGILQSGSLWASSASMLNDTSEMRNGMDRICKAFSDFKRTVSAGDEVSDKIDFVDLCLQSAVQEVADHSVFVISTSARKDSLSQWRAYAGDGGYAIGIDASAPLEVWPEQNYTIPFPGNRRIEWRKVAYSREQSEKLALAVVDRLFLQARPKNEEMSPNAQDRSTWEQKAQNLTYVPKVAAALMKDEGFSDEHEIRWSCLSDGTRDLNFRPGRFGATAYVRVVDARGSTGPRKLPVKEIVIGPNAYPQTAEEGLRALCRQTFYDVSIRHSTVPFR